jgi:DNA repair protein RadC
MTSERVTIHELPVGERPRERLAQHGPQALSSQELLAIVLRSGTRDRGALALAGHLLHVHAGLRGLASAGLADLTRTKGIGKVKAIQIAACFELGKRLMAMPEESRPCVTCAEDAVNLLLPDMRYLDVEMVRALFLDTKCRLIRNEIISSGTLDASLVHPREVFKRAIGVSASRVIVVHNHPSGDPTPSAEDRRVTHDLRKAGEIIGIELADHIIIGDGRWVSFQRDGMI